MISICEHASQGWSCPNCGWGIVTTYFDEIYQDIKVYSIFIKSITDIDKNKIKLISKMAGVNYIEAKQMLNKGNVCILKAKAVNIKIAIEKLKIENIPFEVTPKFNY